MAKATNEKLNFFDPSTCNLCNVGVVKEVTRLVESGLSIRKASEQMAEEVKRSIGEEIYSAKAIARRFENTIPAKKKKDTPPTPPKKKHAAPLVPRSGKEDLAAFISWAHALKPAEKNVLAIILSDPSLTVKGFRQKYSGTDNLLNKMKKKVASFFGFEDVMDIDYDHPIFHSFPSQLPDPWLKGQPKPDVIIRKKVQEDPPADKKKEAEETKKTIQKAVGVPEKLTVEQALQLLGIIGTATAIKSETLDLLINAYEAKQGITDSEMKYLMLAITALKPLEY